MKIKRAMEFSFLHAWNCIGIRNNRKKLRSEFDLIAIMENFSVFTIFGFPNKIFPNFFKGCLFKAFLFILFYFLKVLQESFVLFKNYDFIIFHSASDNNFSAQPTSTSSTIIIMARISRRSWGFIFLSYLYFLITYYLRLFKKASSAPKIILTVYSSFHIRIFYIQFFR